MDKENLFSKAMSDKSDLELKEYINNKEGYQSDAILAATWELEKRDCPVDHYKIVNPEETAVIREEQETLKNIGIPVPTVDPIVRFIHWTIDVLIFQIFGVALSLITYIEVNSLLIYIFRPFYYLFFEYSFGWTPGKYLTGNIAIDSKGTKPGLITIMLRSIIRLIPIEPFSCLGTNSWGWHDKWSKTYVIQSEKLNEVRRAAGLSDYKKSSLLKRVEFGVLGLVFVISIAGLWVIIQELRKYF